ncbi:MAG: DUF1415 domain-containing protein [Candidatus Thiodiazotropha lotti]|uniref:DUF1415 domain-containing protein n=1 Tax=Candidatus Thiodiazotropha lotti TaxID=2792787 RepID=A0A9E4N102_9GAMM|nr:DUF1415 domain-containing protein [Candidatus Thiodiazotropha lotti]ODB99911.1 hypothetical protein A3197_05840 [Candidatus Thiodiazotropha endoloripes]MCG7923767.1 DUF1415 domain-containing protein [Candidatus Thiodiazotropha lotti]MCG7930791.1 DUF1415 domain-containing protein [Candidatus Thiodiazotropha lotti]MCG7941012.1 DUF1415 domain-containing protein [Candidatus Thiodiazotropha lotti]
MNNEAVLTATRCWVEGTVVGLNLCPFAAVPVEAGRIRYLVCPESDMDGIYRAILAEFETMLERQDAEASLLIVPAGLEAFDDYLDLLQVVEEVIPEAGLEGKFQLASFHPDYQFDGSDESDPANYTNRSPYPMFHFIREESLAEALKHYPQPELIPQRNIELLREMGLEAVEQRLARCRKKGG